MGEPLSPVTGDGGSSIVEEDDMKAVAMNGSPCKGGNTEYHIVF
jgi:hypothetical protein